jgi:glucose dehydrogenase
MPKILTILVAASWAFAFSQVTPQNGDWPVYGHDAAGTRYSPLTQINTANVSRLQRAWTYHTGEKGRSLESTPICVHDTL